MSGYIKWFELSAAVMALLHWHRLKADVFIKHLAIVVIFITAVEFSAYFMKYFHNFNTLYYNLFVEPLLFCLYGLAFFKGFKNAKHKKFAFSGAVAVVLIYYCTITIFDPYTYLNIIGYNLGALFIATLAICKIAEVINYSEQPDYFKSPVIYMLLFIILYYLTTIPHFSVSFYFYLNKIKNSATVFLNYVNIFFNYALYTSFAITFLLWGQKKRLY